MLKLGATNGRNVAILGLTDENVKRLTEGKPVLVRVSDFFPDVPAYLDLDVAIFHATREDSLTIGRAYGIPDDQILASLGET